MWAYNQLIRRLGKADRLSDVFEVLDGMARLGVENNHETLEFATNAAIKEVEFETRAVSMKTLPSGKRVDAVGVCTRCGAVDGEAEGLVSHEPCVWPCVLNTLRRFPFEAGMVRAVWFRGAGQGRGGGGHVL